MILFIFIETDIQISFTLCEIESIRDCVLGDSSFIITDHDFTNNNLSIGFKSNNLINGHYGDYNNNINLLSLSFETLGDCEYEDIRLNLALQNPSDTTMDDYFDTISTGGSLPIKIIASLGYSGITIVGDSVLLTNTKNRFDQYINIENPTLVSTSTYARGDSSILYEAHVEQKYSCHVEAMIMLFNNNLYKVAMGFTRTCFFYVRTLSPCGDIS